MKRTFSAKIENLPEVSQYIEEELEKYECPFKVSLQIQVAVEEIFVNIAHYAYPEKNGEADIDIVFDEEEKMVSIAFSDEGIEFNPLLKPDPDVTLSAEERGIGGLGIFMVKKTMTKVLYDYKDGKNVLTILKKFNQ